MGKQTFSFKARRRLHVESPLVYKAKNDSTLSVPLPDYNELRTSKGRGRAVQAIRLYARENANNRNKPARYMHANSNGVYTGQKKKCRVLFGSRIRDEPGVPALLQTTFDLRRGTL